MSEIQELKHLKLSLTDIKLATNYFADDNFIIKGAFWRVYKGQLSGESNTTVLVKRLDNTTGQRHREFLNEIAMLSSFTHDNLVSLVGFSDEGDEKILVYKHEVNGSLDNHLASKDLTWEQRLRICLGAARGLDFLHCGMGTGHRDIKSSNILLDENWEAKISDFGLSKIGPKNQDFIFVVPNNVGTYGYVDPQYIATGVYSKESDIFSFGVVMFEVLCGRPAFIPEYYDVRSFLYILAIQLYQEGILDEIIIPALKAEMNPDSLKVFSKIAYQCLNKDSKNRPTMDSIVQELTISLEFQMACSGVLPKRSELFGTILGGYPWSLQLDNNQMLRKITIDHKDWIHSIGFTIQDSLTGQLISSQYGGYYGPSGGELNEINIDDDEDIIEIIGTVGVTSGDLTKDLAGLKVISSLCFMTSKKKYGPFGVETNNRFSVSWDVDSFAGFYGRAGSYLDGLGFYSKATNGKAPLDIESG